MLLLLPPVQELQLLLKGVFHLKIFPLFLEHFSLFASLSLFGLFLLGVVDKFILQISVFPYFLMIDITIVVVYILVLLIIFFASVSMQKMILVLHIFLAF